MSKKIQSHAIYQLDNVHDIYLNIFFHPAQNASISVFSQSNCLGDNPNLNICASCPECKDQCFSQSNCLEDNPNFTKKSSEFI